MPRRLSLSAAYSSARFTLPVMSPRPSGLYGTNPIPSSRQAGSTSPSTSRSNSEYSDWRALMGCTVMARRSVEGPASDSPRYLTFPARTNSAIVPTTSSMGIPGSTRC